MLKLEGRGGTNSSVKDAHWLLDTKAPKPFSFGGEVGKDFVREHKCYLKENFKARGYRWFLNFKQKPGILIKLRMGPLAEGKDEG